MVLGTNGAAQLHAEAARDGCFTGHWGLDGTTPGMRYASAGGYQVNAENVTGLNYCIKARDNFQRISNLDVAVRKAVNGLSASPGHNNTPMSEQFLKVNLGIAWDTHIVWLVQQFEGDHVRFGQLPALEGTNLTFAGQPTNGARMDFGQNGLKVDIYYHPLSPLTQGQIAKAYCLDIGIVLGTLIPPAPPGFSYDNLDPAPKVYQRCNSPYDAPSTSEAPSSYFDARGKYLQGQILPTSLEVGTVRFVVADRWNVEGTSFSVSADIGDILDLKGPGVYQLLFWGTVYGKPKVVADYQIFHRVPLPKGYD